MRYPKPAPTLLEIFSNPRILGWGLLTGVSALGVGIFFIASPLVGIATIFLVCAPALVGVSKLLKNDAQNSLEEIQKSRQEKTAGYSQTVEQEQNISYDIPAQKKYTELVQPSSQAPQLPSRV